MIPGVGRKTVAAAGTAEALAAPKGVDSVAITAETDNTGVIVVGDSSVVAAIATRKGTPLAAGESVAFSNDGTGEKIDLSRIFLDTTVNGDGVTYTYLD